MGDSNSWLWFRRFLLLLQLLTLYSTIHHYENNLKKDCNLVQSLSRFTSYLAISTETTCTKTIRNVKPFNSLNFQGVWLVYIPMPVPAGA